LNIKNKLVCSIDLLEIIILFFTILTLKLPISISGILLIFSIFIIYRNRDMLVLDPELKKIFFYFGLFLLFFTFYSIDIKLSFKGFYDIFRGFLIFPITIILINKVNNQNINNYFITISFLFLLGNFLFNRGYYFGYFNNPNNVSMEVFIATLVGLLFFNSKDKFNIIITFSFLVSSIYLIFLAGTRGVIIGIFFGIIVILNVYYQKKIVILYQLIIVGISSFYLFYFSQGLNLSRREEIWLPLFKDTIENNLFFGSGINSVKLVIERLDSITQTAHNLFLEIFVSTGLVGLCIFIYLLYLLFIYFRKQKYIKNHIFYFGIFGVTSIFIMYQVDLKFTENSFMGMVFYFLGLIYSQINIERSKN
jgi:hypothetical protein